MRFSPEEVKDWNTGRGALILSIERLAQIRNALPDVLIMTSGGFDPIHPGHMTSFVDAKRRYCERVQSEGTRPSLLVLVNGDVFLFNKKGRPFMDIKTRCQIVSMCQEVDMVVPFDASDPDDMTVCEALRLIRPNVFAKGGDRSGIENIPEWPICQELGIDIATELGEAKHWSSSSFLDKWSKTCGELSADSLSGRDCSCVRGGGNGCFTQ